MDMNESDMDSVHGKDKNRDEHNDDFNLNQLKPRGQDKIELFDYLTNTMSLEIKEVKSINEKRMYPKDDTREPWQEEDFDAKPKFITVKATKQKNKGSVGNAHSSGSGQHLDKKIKLELVDHSKEHGIPYKNQIVDEDEKD